MTHLGAGAGYCFPGFTPGFLVVKKAGSKHWEEVIKDIKGAFIAFLASQKPSKLYMCFKHGVFLPSATV